MWTEHGHVALSATSSQALLQPLTSAQKPRKGGALRPSGPSPARPFRLPSQLLFGRQGEDAACDLGRASDFTLPRADQRHRAETDCEGSPWNRDHRRATGARLPPPRVPPGPGSPGLQGNWPWYPRDLTEGPCVHVTQQLSPSRRGCTRAV